MESRPDDLNLLLKDKNEFNHSICVDVMFIQRYSVNDVVDEATEF